MWPTCLAGQHRPTSAHQNAAVGPLWRNVKTVPSPPEHSKMGAEKEKQDKGLPSQVTPALSLLPAVRAVYRSPHWGQNKREIWYLGSGLPEISVSQEKYWGQSPEGGQNERKVKFALYLPPEKKAELERRYREDGSRSITAFIERAIDFYLSYLSASNTGTFLPKKLQAAINGRLGMFEDRMAKLLYKLTVEMDMGMSATLDCIQIDADYLRRLRANSVRNVKATNGLLTFEQKARAYDDYAEGDDQWQG